MMAHDIQVVLCEHLRTSQWRFWCPFCKAYHYHGAGPGHRVAHCASPASPFRDGGYILKAQA